MLPCFRASGLPGFRASGLPCFRASVLPCFRASVLPCFRASVLPCFRASGLPGFRASGLPGFVTGSAPARVAASGAPCLSTRQLPAPQRGRPGADGRPPDPAHAHRRPRFSHQQSGHPRHLARRHAPARRRSTSAITGSPRPPPFPAPNSQLLYKT
ncbi:hypothetical protein D7209_06825 [Burkholderia cepacia]|nr:hypothetical protein [Burkholderia cepacia]MBB0016165.1 hypothetical protein [Burkholderia cepacia]MBB0044486.1 hypothetical protein [Burkholderia cepacia]